MMPVNFGTHVSIKAGGELCRQRMAANFKTLFSPKGTSEVWGTFFTKAGGELRDLIFARGRERFLNPNFH
jgi:hypothetical protein